MDRYRDIRDAMSAGDAGDGGGDGDGDGQSEEGMSVPVRLLLLNLGIMYLARLSPHGRQRVLALASTFTWARHRVVRSRHGVNDPALSWLRPMLMQWGEETGGEETGGLR